MLLTSSCPCERPAPSQFCRRTTTASTILRNALQRTRAGPDTHFACAVTTPVRLSSLSSFPCGQSLYNCGDRPQTDEVSLQQAVWGVRVAGSSPDDILSTGLGDDQVEGQRRELPSGSRLTRFKPDI